MKTIPTAKTFIINKLTETQPNSKNPPTSKQVEEWMVEFTKMHVTEALKQASEKAIMSLEESSDDPYDHYAIVDKDSILTAYSLDNIK